MDAGAAAATAAVAGAAAVDADADREFVVVGEAPSDAAARGRRTVQLLGRLAFRRRLWAALGSHLKEIMNRGRRG